MIGLIKIGLLRCCDEATEHVGLFFVYKKNKTLRMICDARRSNARFQEPPSVKLATGDSLSRPQVPPGDTLYVASLDLKDYFHTLRIPARMSQCFCLPLISCRCLRAAGLDVQSDQDFVYPCFASLPHGFLLGFVGCAALS